MSALRDGPDVAVSGPCVLQTQDGFFGVIGWALGWRCSSMTAEIPLFVLVSETHVFGRVNNKPRHFAVRRMEMLYDWECH